MKLKKAMCCCNYYQLKVWLLVAQMMHNGWMLLLSPFIGHKWRPVWEGTPFYLFQKTMEHIAVIICIRFSYSNQKFIFHVTKYVLCYLDNIKIHLKRVWSVPICDKCTLVQCESSCMFFHLCLIVSVLLISPSLSAVCMKTYRNFFPYFNLHCLLECF